MLSTSSSFKTLYVYIAVDLLIFCDHLFFFFFFSHVGSSVNLPLAIGELTDEALLPFCCQNTYDNIVSKIFSINIVKYVHMYKFQCYAVVLCPSLNLVPANINWLDLTIGIG